MDLDITCPKLAQTLKESITLMFKSKLCLAGDLSSEKSLMADYILSILNN